MRTTVHVTEDGLIEVVAPLERITLTRRQSIEIAARVLVVQMLVDAINALPPDMRAQITVKPGKDG